MNWKRGLIRTWFVFSSLWFLAGAALIAVFSIQNKTVSRERSPEELVECILKNSKSLCDMLGEVKHVTVWVWPPWPIVVGVVIVPLLAYALGAACYWAAKGFRPN